MTKISTASLSPADTEERWKKAIKEARAAAKAAGVPIKIRQNVMSCCRGCITHEQMGLAADDETTAYAFTFGGQGNRIQWRRGNPVYGVKKSSKYSYDESCTPETAAYWNHDNGAAPFLKEAFEANGFEVDWDGSDMRTVIVKFPDAILSQRFHAIEVEGRVYVAKSKYGAMNRAGVGYAYSHMVREFAWSGPLVADLAEDGPHFAEIQAAAVEALVTEEIASA